jgi:hypothetical protein
MNGFQFIIVWGVIIVAFVALGIVWARWHRQAGGTGVGPMERADGSIAVNPTGYPEGMKGHAKVITPTENNAADYK